MRRHTSVDDQTVGLDLALVELVNHTIVVVLDDLDAACVDESGQSPARSLDGVGITIESDQPRLGSRLEKRLGMSASAEGAVDEQTPASGGQTHHHFVLEHGLVVEAVHGRYSSTGAAASLLPHRSSWSRACRRDKRSTKDGRDAPGRPWPGDIGDPVARRASVKVAPETDSPLAAQCNDSGAEENPRYREPGPWARLQRDSGTFPCLRFRSSYC